MTSLPSPSLLDTPTSRPAPEFDELVEVALRGLKPEPALTVSQWADAHRMLPDTSAEPGRWRTRRTPYLREIMDVLSANHPAERVVLMKGAQTGGSEAGNNWLGYVIHHAPGLMLLVMPVLAMVKRNTLTRIDPLIEATPELRERVAAVRSRDATNSIFRKKFQGGELIMTGANSAIGLRSTPARYLFGDEVDAYVPDVDGEGDPVDLAEKRTVTFASRRKIYLVSTPTVRGISRIEKAYLASDQRRYFVPCAKCEAWDYLTWDKIGWEEDAPQAAGYVCQACGYTHREFEKSVLLERGQWRPTATGDGRTVGFHLSALYSPFETWGNQVAEFLRVKDDPSRLKTWINTTLGETWVLQGEAPDWELLYARRESYAIGTIPARGLLLTAGVDVQADRIEVEVVAWRGLESWSVEHRVLLGNPSQLDDPIWRELTALLNERFPHALGASMMIERLAIDDGYQSQVVRLWARAQKTPRVMVVKGSDRQARDVSKPTYVDISYRGKEIKRGTRLYFLGTHLFKDALYGALKASKPTDEELAKGATYPHNYCHFPEYADEYFKQLTAETLTKRRTRQGYEVPEWVKTRERNEALDCRVYAMGAAYSLGLTRLSDAAWKHREKALLAAAHAAPRPVEPSADDLVVEDVEEEHEEHEEFGGAVVVGEMSDSSEGEKTMDLLGGDGPPPVVDVPDPPVVQFHRRPRRRQVRRSSYM